MRRLDRFPTVPVQSSVLDLAPGWVRSTLGALTAAFVSSAAVVVPVFVAWLLTPAAVVPASQAVVVGLDAWLAAHGVAMGVEHGRVHLVPWLITLVPFACLYWAGQAVAAELPDEAPTTGPGTLLGVRRDVVTRGLIFAGAYAVVTLLVALVARTAGFVPGVPGAVVWPFLLAALAYAVCVRRRFDGHVEDVAPRVAWAVREYLPEWVRSSLRPAGAGVVTLTAWGLLLAVALVAAQFSRVATLYGAVGAGWFGGALLTLTQLGFLPNAATWGVAFSAGPGFGVGAGSTVRWLHSGAEFLPLVPVFGALPDPGPLPWWTVLTVLAPVGVGAGVGLACIRACPGGVGAGEDGRELLLRRMRCAATGAALTAVGTGVLVWLGSGSLGSGRLAHVGADAWLVTAALLVESCLGAVAAALVTGTRVVRPASRAATTKATAGTQAVGADDEVGGRHLVGAGVTRVRNLLRRRPADD